MSTFLDRLKEELDMFSEIQPMITVSRKDLEKLIKAYENLKASTKS